MKDIDSYYIRHFCQLPKRRLEWMSMPGRDVLECVQFCGHLLPDRNELPPTITRSSYVAGYDMRLRRLVCCTRRCRLVGLWLAAQACLDPRHPLSRITPLYDQDTSPCPWLEKAGGHCLSRT